MALTMRARSSVVRLAFRISVVLMVPALAGAQTREHHQPAPPRVKSTDSVTIAASPRYASTGFKRFFLGDTYRDLWTTPIRVPVLSMTVIFLAGAPAGTGMLVPP